MKVKGGSFKEDFKYNAREIRFTTKGATLYAIALGWPEDGQLTIRSLAKPAGENVNDITEVSLLGYKGKLEWKQTADGLVVTLPAQKVSEYTAALKITGTQPQEHSLRDPHCRHSLPMPKATFILGADDAELHGDQIKTEDHGGQSNIGFWDNGSEWASWNVQFPQAGTFKVSASVASISGSSQFVIEAAGQQISGMAAQTAGWDQFKEIDLGQLEVKQPGRAGGEDSPRRRPELAAHEPALREAHESGIATPVDSSDAEGRPLMGRSPKRGKSTLCEITRIIGTAWPRGHGRTSDKP